jgi:NAD(P)-dependent dehydrogenase (short-subunit alcohol dehydrogenase family)
MKDLFSVKDKVAIVTGGMGQLGRQFCQALADRGARVVVMDRRVAADAAAKAFPHTHNSMMFMESDVTSRASLEQALASIQAKWGAPEILVNNAGLDSPPSAPASETGPFEDYPESSWDMVMAVNMKGVFLSCQVFGGAMAKAGRGSIINISSIYGVVSPDQRIYEFRRKDGNTFFKPVAYSASKSGIINLTRYLSTYWAEKGVRVNTLTFAGVFNNQPQEFLKGYCAKVPLGRMANPDEYNGAILFLSSEASSYMTGSNMVLDGGFTAW